jgi:nucleoside-diphosphate-sugar epimerase
MRYKNLIITGSTSYLGREFLKKYHLSFENIFAIVRAETDRTILKNISNIQFSQWPKDKEKLLKHQFDYMIHMATCYGRKNESKNEIFKTNVSFPSELAEALKNQISNWINIDTTLPPEVNYYSQTKYEFLQFLKVTNKPKVLNLKLQQIYGPNDGTFVTFIINSLLENVAHVDMSKGTQRRDFIYIDDVISAIYFCMKKPQEDSFNQIDIGTGKTYTIREVVEKLQNFSSQNKTKFNWGKKTERDNEPQELVASISKLQATGWRPQFDLTSGLDLTFKKMTIK